MMAVTTPGVGSFSAADFSAYTQAVLQRQRESGKASRQSQELAMRAELAGQQASIMRDQLGLQTKEFEGAEKRRSWKHAQEVKAGQELEDLKVRARQLHALTRAAAEDEISGIVGVTPEQEQDIFYKHSRKAARRNPEIDALLKSSMRTYTEGESEEDRAKQRKRAESAEKRAEEEHDLDITESAAEEARRKATFPLDLGIKAAQKLFLEAQANKLNGTGSDDQLAEARIGLLVSAIASKDINEEDRRKIFAEIFTAAKPDEISLLINTMKHLSPWISPGAASIDAQARKTAKDIAKDRESNSVVLSLDQSVVDSQADRSFEHLGIPDDINTFAGLLKYPQVAATQLDTQSPEQLKMLGGNRPFRSRVKRSISERITALTSYQKISSAIKTGSGLLGEAVGSLLPTKTLTDVLEEDKDLQALLGVAERTGIDLNALFKNLEVDDILGEPVYFENKDGEMVPIEGSPMVPIEDSRGFKQGGGGMSIQDFQFQAP